MQYKGSNGNVYLLGSELGRGGEGIVYYIQNQPKYVAKIYIDKVPAQLSKKLAFMIQENTDLLQQYTTWPIDSLWDHQGNCIGYLMQRLDAYLPMHMAFNPMDRKQYFPDKGYNFLIHIARNLAVAVHKLHELGIIIGDINEGNILINNRGMIHLIDCDSFQVKSIQEVFPCTVGIPRYTAPELLAMGSFENVIRTVDMDNFSLAILIFQLLFLGRHPFSGKNQTKKDIDEETAIRNGAFAYSLQSSKKLLTPPKHSLDINIFSNELIDAFHQAFESPNRPSAKTWITTLEQQQSALAICIKNGAHTYPNKAKQCPWCQFKLEQGIVFFLDQIPQDTQEDGLDMAHFINGFKLDQFILNTFQFAPIPTNIRSHKDRLISTLSKIALLFNILLIGGLFLLYLIEFIEVFNLYVSYALVFMLNYLVAIRLRFTRTLRLKKMLNPKSVELQNMMQHYNMGPEKVTFKQEVNQFKVLIDTYKQLQERHTSLRNRVEAQMYYAQLRTFLSDFALSDAQIPSIGPSRKAALLQAGLLFASDIGQLKVMKVSGIGPKNIQALIDWQQQLSTKFVYQPENDKIALEVANEQLKMKGERIHLEHQLKLYYQSLIQLKANIDFQYSSLSKQLNEYNTTIHQLKEAIYQVNRQTAIVRFALGGA